MRHSVLPAAPILHPSSFILHPSVFILVLLAAPAARAVGPLGYNNYVNIRVESMNFHSATEFSAPPPAGPGLQGSVTVPSGISADWGGFSSEYVAAGTRIGYTRADPAFGQALLLGGGPQFHIPLGEDVLLAPGINISYRLSNAGMGFGAYFSLALAWRLEGRYYLGLEGEQPLWLQGPGFLPSSRSANLLFGLYY